MGEVTYPVFLGFSKIALAHANSIPQLFNIAVDKVS